MTAMILDMDPSLSDDRPATDQQSSRHTRRVLVVDDNPDLQEIYEFWFHEAGYDVKVSSNGLDGLENVKSFQPHVIVLDIMMPEMSGYGFLEELRKNEATHVPVVVVSNLAQEDDKQKALAAGADLYLIKSDFEGPDIVAHIHQFLEKKGTSNPTEE